MKTVIPWLLFLLIAFFLSLCSCSRADAFSCPGGFISVGASMEEVLSKCGQPAASESWEEARAISAPIIFDSRYGPFSYVVYIPMETWLYNFGPNRFMQTLTFERRKLVNIESAGYGY